MRAYISGPMTGLPNHNFAAFAEAAHWLRQHICENVVSPHEVETVACDGCKAAKESPAWSADELPVARPHNWAEHMKADIAALLECDTIVMLLGWPSSRGARLELTIAMELGFKVFFYNADGVEKLTEMSR